MNSNYDEESSLLHTKAEQDENMQNFTPSKTSKVALAALSVAAIGLGAIGLSYNPAAFGGLSTSNLQIAPSNIKQILGSEMAMIDSIQQHSVMCPGDALYVGDELVSADGNMKLVMQADGNVVIKRGDTGNTVLWETDTDHVDTTKVELRFQVDGNIVEYVTRIVRDDAGNVESEQDSVPWASNQYGDTGDGIYVVMQNDGSLAKYNREGLSKWNSASQVAGLEASNAALGSNVCVPTSAPVAAPTDAPTDAPVAHPTHTPTADPISNPTMVPTLAPSHAPSRKPSTAPISTPTLLPTQEPIGSPTGSPVTTPTFHPTLKPTMYPTLQTDAPTPVPHHDPTPVPHHDPTGTPVAAAVPEPAAEPAAEPEEPAAVPAVGSGDSNYCAITFTKGVTPMSAPKGCALFAVDDLSFLTDGQTTKAFYGCADTSSTLYITPDELTRVGLMVEDKSQITSIYPGEASFVSFYTEPDFTGYSYTFNSNYHHELTHFHFDGTSLGNDAVHSVKVRSLTSTFSLPDSCQDTFKL